MMSIGDVMHWRKEGACHPYVVLMSMEGVTIAASQVTDHQLRLPGPKIPEEELHLEQDCPYRGVDETKTTAGTQP